MKSNLNSSNKVAIIGTGFVGSTTAYSLMLDGIASDIALIDRDSKIARGHALDLEHGMQFTNSANIVAGDSFELVENAKIVIVTAGSAQISGQPRSELLKTNINIFKKIIPEIAKYNKDCILLIVTNPLDVMTYVAYKLSGFEKCKVFGSGTVLDTSRLRYLMGQEFKISPKDINAYILGEHGDSQFVWWSHANIAGMPIANFSKDEKELLNKLYKKVRDSVYEVIDKKGATYFAIATVITKMVRAILTNQARVFTVSSVIKDKDGSDLCISIPTVLRTGGICQVLNVDLDKQEQIFWDKSCNKIKSEIAQALDIIY
ncbi:L-lactate dehydrogenase [Candidatus Dependentiae bacterium]|nr:L-lactate dehydrogenase [Candidatus Dependentiae bacterium]MBU4387608.1 L-lactate dehydrogenase [Candidatus Dependentiae bacterium]MCG2756270.1 L-lactate dehydrogenase [Candidatus Dependentiae bacterium]